MLLCRPIHLVKALAGYHSIHCPANRMCYFTGHENWLSIEILDPQGVSQVYEVFFNLRRQGNKFLRVYVESAYVRTAENEIRQPSGFRK